MKKFKITSKKTKKTLLASVPASKFHPMQSDVLGLEINDYVYLDGGIMFPDRSGFTVDIEVKRIK
jgi:hypothetical protein